MDDNIHIINNTASQGAVRLTQNHTDASAAGPAESGYQPSVTLDQIIDLCIEQEASDIHLGEGRKIALRIGGKIVFIDNIEPLSKKDAEAIIFTMIPEADMRSRLMSMRDIDFSYSARRGVSFRVNAFFQRGRLSAVMRMAPKYAPNIDDLGVPVELKQLLTLREGLIMVCGNAGSGKSHTMQAIVQYINDHFVQHIVTIENPIEHIFEDNKCIISQREIGKDTLSFVSGIHSAVREDPNVIIISEINDMETMEAVINLVETGHLVISSTLSRKVGQVMERMVGFFPHTQKEQIQNRLSECMLAVLTQDLCERIDRPGRIAVYEFMINSPSVHQIIRHHKIDQVNTAIQSGAMEGMITMDAYAQQLAEQGIIAPETVDLFREHKF